MSTATHQQPTASDHAATVMGEFLAAPGTNAVTAQAAKGKTAQSPTASPTRRSRRFTVITHILAGVGGLFTLWLALTFLIAPESAVVGFGVSEWPHGGAVAFLNVKGGRDLGLTLVLFALLATRQTRAVGWAMLAMAISPLCDMTIVMAYGGSPAYALMVHGSAVLYLLVVGALIVWNEHPRKSDTRAGR